MIGERNNGRGRTHSKPVANLRRKTLAVLCVVAWAASCSGASPPEQVYQRIIDDAVAAGVPGLQAHVRRGTARWNGTAGVCSVETGRAMTPNQPIRVASITKMITYATVMELVKQKRLRLSDRATSLLPSGALDKIPDSGAITIEHLLDHNSGLHNFNGEQGSDFFRDLFGDVNRGTRRWTAADLLVYAKKKEHRSTGRPGERVAYSSTGYLVLQMILEHVEKKALPDIYRAVLLEPLEMRLTGLEGGNLTTAEIADSYARPAPGDSFRPSPFAGRSRVRADGLVNLSSGLRYYNAWAQGAGAVAAPAGDLAKFMDAVSTGRVEVLHDQARPICSIEAKGRKVFRLERRLVGHSGDHPFRALSRYYCDRALKCVERWGQQPRDGPRPSEGRAKRKLGQVLILA